MTRNFEVFNGTCPATTWKFQVNLYAVQDQNNVWNAASSVWRTIGCKCVSLKFLRIQVKNNHSQCSILYFVLFIHKHPNDTFIVLFHYCLTYVSLHKLFNVQLNQMWKFDINAFMGNINWKLNRKTLSVVVQLLSPPWAI